MAGRGIEHGPLELLFTVDEETGLTGARELSPGLLRSRTLLNLDSEDEGVLTWLRGGADTIAPGRSRGAGAKAWSRSTCA